ncbi:MULTISPECIES: relaxase domain-containing protein [unclassified Streptomyces]|uniref:relaxase domain-containing protein n=1 Tax=unclassified Streptomyces TaxID=2593676 RepID=UPI0036A47669
MRAAQDQAGVPVGRRMGRGLAVLGPAPGEEVTEAQLRNWFGERGRHPYAHRIEAERLAAGDSPKKAYRAGALGRTATVTGVDFVVRPQPAIYLLWAFGDEETRLVIGAARERGAGVDRGRGCGDPARTGSIGCGRPVMWSRASATTRRGRVGRCSTPICF